MNDDDYRALAQQRTQELLASMKFTPEEVERREILAANIFNEAFAASPIAHPGPNETVGRCHKSRTGWAIYKSACHCTCRPANPPR